jgi:phosphoadenosine phosphosulfate reductase
MPSSIELHARKTRGFEARVAHAVALLREAAEDHAGRVVQATSLGVEGMVLTDMIARHGLPIAVATLDTGRLYAQTLALLARIELRYGVAVEVFHPRQEAVVHFVRRHGPDAMFESVELRQRCCELRKVEPMKRLLAGRSAWITGLRREQSEHRSVVPFFEVDAEGREKFYPLADWSDADVWHYVEMHDVPYNELHDHFFPSIGCAPCTRAVVLGSDARAGRWWWEGESARECGLHRRPEPAAA